MSAVPDHTRQPDPTPEKAREYLGKMSDALWVDAKAALERMREAMRQDPDRVRDLLAAGHLKEFGTPHTRRPSENALVSKTLADGGADRIERNLRIDAGMPPRAPRPQAPAMVTDEEIRRALDGPDAESLGRAEPDTRTAGAADTRDRDDSPPAPGDSDQRDAGSDPYDGLDEDERRAYDELNDFAEAQARVDARREAEAQIHGIRDHREHLKAAEANLAAAEAELAGQVDATYRSPESAMRKIEESIASRGVEETAKRIRSGKLLGNDQNQIRGEPRLFHPNGKRDRRAEASARDQVATRIESVGAQRAELAKYSRYQTFNGGPDVVGAEDVYKALDRDERRIREQSGIATGDNPYREANDLGRRASDRMSGLSERGKARVGDRLAQSRKVPVAPVLQKIERIARLVKEGMEGPQP